MARVAITGASGLLGANLAEVLLGDGHEVVATRRAGSKVGHLEDLKLEWREAELGDVAALQRAFADVEAVFHCAATVSVRKDTPPEMAATNVDGTRNVLAAVRGAGVKRLIHTSSVVAIGLSTDGAPCDETTTWNYADYGLMNGYASTKHQAEVDVLASELDVVVVNPTYMFGPRDVRPSSGKLLLDVARRKLPGTTPGYNNFVDVRDVARGLVSAWQKGRRGERYILGGHDLTYHDMFTLAAQVAGVPAPRLRLPFAVARVVGWVGDLIEKRGGDPLVNSTQVRYAFSDRFRFTSAKAERELGYTYGPLERAMADALTWFRAHHML